MFLRNLTTAAAGVLAASLVLGLGVSSAPPLLAPAHAQDKPTVAEQPPAPGGATPKTDSPKTEPPADKSPLDLLLPKKPLRPIPDDELKMIGAWKVTEVKVAGEPRDPEDMNICFGPFGTMIIADDPAKPGKTMTFKLNPSGNPKTIELTAGGKTQAGIYQFIDGGLHLWLGLKGEDPANLDADKGSNAVLFVLRTLSPSCDTKWADALFVTGRSHNFGALQGGERVTHKFVVKNVYDRPVAIAAEPFVRADVQFGGAGGMGLGFGGQPGPMGGGGFNPGGGAPAGGGGVPMGPGGFAPAGGAGPGGPVNLWASVSSPPMQWLQPGEETTIEVVAVAPFGNAPKVIIDVSFHVRGMTRPRQFMSRGGRSMAPPMVGSEREQLTEIGQSAVELVLTAEGKK
jgi:uncharacterized protein (TIGR03067 family)